jgi:hypothetical protein
MKNKFLKSTGAVLCGFLISVILSIGTDLILEKTGILNTKQFDTNPNWLIIFVIIYRCIYNTTGSYLTAKLAPGRPLRLAMIGGFIGLAISITGTIIMWDVPPHWYPLTLIVLALPCAWIGGKLYESKKNLQTWKKSLQ